jgi:uncharacterized protein YrrD
MKIEWKKFKGLGVETKSGVVLGKVKNFILETDGQSILQYEVGDLFTKKYLISREQVISIDSEKMVVEDIVLQVENQSEDRSINSGIEPVTMRESE